MILLLVIFTIFIMFKIKIILTIIKIILTCGERQLIQEASKFLLAGPHVAFGVSENVNNHDADEGDYEHHGQVMMVFWRHFHHKPEESESP